jgi:hypothetical protein
MVEAQEDTLKPLINNNIIIFIARITPLKH